MPPFKFEEVSDFDTHIVSSIPTFDQLNYLAARLTYDFSQEGTHVVDIGCSTGRFLRSIPKREGITYIGIDKTMMPEPTQGIKFLKKDIMAYPLPKCSVIISLFTAQFLPYHMRDDFFAYVEDALVEGGVFICAEKMHMENPAVETVVQANLLEWKKQHFTDTEIVDKAIGLKSVMYCQSQNQLRESLERIGNTDCIWQWGAFGCFISRKQTYK